MEHLRGSGLRALLDCLRDIHTARDLDALRRRLPRAIAAVVPAEMTTYFEIERRTRNVTAITYPGDAVDAAAERAFDRTMHHSPLFRAYRRGQGSAVKNSDFLTRAKFRRLPLYDEFFRPVGVEHQMVKGLPGRPGLITGIALFRRSRDFTEGNRVMLNLLRPHLNEAYQAGRLLTEMREELDLWRRGFEHIDRGLIAVDAGGRIRLMTARARQWIADYFGRTRNGELPDALRRWIEYDAALLAGSSALATPRAPLIAERDGHRLDIRMVFDGDQRLLLLDEQRTEPIAAETLERLGLSRRQTEVLVWIAEGKTNGEIATILGMSERTVEKHVQHILERLGVETRTAAAARALSVR
jgi:DNA-binding CsgD family transcriptional regulator